MRRSHGIAPRAFPSLSCDIRRGAPVHGEKGGLAAGPGVKRMRGGRLEDMNLE